MWSRDDDGFHRGQGFHGTDGSSVGNCDISGITRGDEEGGKDANVSGELHCGEIVWKYFAIYTIVKGWPSRL